MTACVCYSYLKIIKTCSYSSCIGQKPIVNELKAHCRSLHVKDVFKIKGFRNSMFVILNLIHKWMCLLYHICIYIYYCTLRTRIKHATLTVHLLSHGVHNNIHHLSLYIHKHICTYIHTHTGWTKSRFTVITLAINHRT